LGQETSVDVFYKKDKHGLIKVFCLYSKTKKGMFRQEVVVYWSRQMAHDQEIVGSNPSTVYWMDVSNASYYIKEKLKIKDAKWGTPTKYLKKEC
jgi:hypothetical protein